MRTEQEMFDLILAIANANERVRAVYLNGSKANSKLEKDIYQDYDIVFSVTNTEPFISDNEWLKQFGEPLIIQEPDSNDLGWGINNDSSKNYIWLMLFTDGTRIDLSIETLSETKKNYGNDSLTIPLLDKDNILPNIPDANDSDYWITPPSKEKYYGCCNEFWWCLNNVAKGIARDQLPYALRMYSETVHKELERMIEWYIGLRNEYMVTSGMWGKYFKKYLESEYYELFLKTYTNAEPENIWVAIFVACDLFHLIGISVAKHFNFTYKKNEEDGIRKYLSMVKDEISIRK